MDSSMCSSAPDPEMWIIQGTLAWRTSPVRTGAVREGPPRLLSSRESIHPLSVYGQLSLEHRDQEIGSSRKKKAWLINNPLLGLRPPQSLRTPPISAMGCDGPAAPRKRIEEAFDSFMHAPLGSGGYSSVGRAPLLQLGRCDYGLDV
ncbi:hypothetical protein FF2_033499 [Malus domestica]